MTVNELIERLENIRRDGNGSLGVVFSDPKYWAIDNVVYGAQNGKQLVVLIHWS